MTFPYLRVENISSTLEEKSRISARPCPRLETFNETDYSAYHKQKPIVVLSFNVTENVSNYMASSFFLILHLCDLLFVSQVLRWHFSGPFV